MIKTNAADEATLDGKISSQDLVFVSNAKLKIEIKSNLLCDYLLEVILSTSAPPPSNPCPSQTCLGYAADCLREIKRERQVCPTGMRPTIPGDRRGPASPLRQRPLKQRSNRPADHLSPRLETTSPPTTGLIMKIWEK